MKKYYVYDLIDPRNNQPFYVGKGQGGRMYNHVTMVRNSRRDHNTQKCEMIESIMNEGLEVIHSIVEWFDSDKEALTYERDRIHSIGRVIDSTGPLLNIKSGDDKPRKHERPINQCDYCTGTIVNTYNSTKLAADALGIKWVSSLANAVRGKIPSYAGFIWHYVDEPVRLPPTLIYIWGLDEQLISIQKNEGDASRFIGCAAAQLHACIKSRRPCKGNIISTSPTFPGIADRRPNFPVWEKGLQNKPVIHINTQTTYPTVTAAAKATKHNVGYVSACCLGSRPDICGDMFKFVVPQISPTDGE